jgi:Ca2+-binding RTX toxin-like protein
MLLFGCALIPVSGVSGALPGTSGKIVFASDRTTANRHLWVMNADGSNPTLLDPPRSCSPSDPDCNPATGCAFDAWQPFCNITNDDDGHPAWSPDGTTIAFDSSRSPDGPRFDHRELFVMNADGSGVVRLTASLSDASNDPAWSPDGARIAFVRYQVGVGDEHIWIMNSDGSGLVQLTSSTEPDGDPEWSPDGTQIVYVRAGHAGNFDQPGRVYVVNADGTNEHQITGLGNQPAWSPDGSKIAYRGAQGQLFTINPDGSGAVAHTADPWGHFDPEWSPDGRKVVYQATGFEAIHVVDAVGGNDIDLTPGAPGLNDQPDWQRRPCTILGTAGDDVISGTPGDDVICALGGNDTVKASGGSDTVFGAEGNDRLTGGAGDDVLLGGPGNDRFLEEAAASGRDVFYGGAGTDKVDYSKRSANLTASINGLPGSGESGEADAISTDVENLTGGAGDDSLTGSDLKNVLDGGSGTNTLVGGGGNDKLIGGAGSDNESGGPGNDNLLGAGGDDSLDGGVGKDKLTDGLGSDHLFGGDDNDKLNTQDGVGGNDSADGGNGTDACLADPGDTVLNCEA